MAHFIHYLHRRVLLPTQSSMASQRFAASDPDAPPFDLPTRHVLPGQLIVRSIVAGDTIWMISQMSLRQAGTTSWLPVALDARINVDAPPTQEGDVWVATPAAGSRWFPLADATCVLSELKSVRRGGSTSSLGIGTAIAVGQHFQGVRRLDTAEPLKRWVSHLVKERVEFISYRQIDGTAAAFNFASARLSTGATLFFDKWNLPRRLSERREDVPDGPLDASLLRALDEASCVWGIETPQYYEADGYAAKEATRARERRIFRAVPSLPDKRRPR